MDEWSGRIGLDAGRHDSSPGSPRSRFGRRDRMGSVLDVGADGCLKRACELVLAAVGRCSAGPRTKESGLPILARGNFASCIRRRCPTLVVACGDLLFDA